jgi:hypothetical protein
MTSPEQIEANRRNAALSTGPRTPAGKAACCLNASRHGLLARELLVKGESKGDFTAFADGVRERLAPDGELEIFVVNRVISAAWRLRRALTVESALFNSGGGPASADLSGGALAKIRLLSRYEVTLERSLYKALERLDHLRRVRRSDNPGDRWGGYAALSAARDKTPDPLALPPGDAKEETQQKTDEIGFVSQKCINPEGRVEGLRAEIARY